MGDSHKMNKQHKNKLRHMTMGALLAALAIIIPIIMPPGLKIVIGDASFTLASHVPIMLAMFFSPFVAAFVALASTIGFIIAGMPMGVWLRALTHIIFAVAGAFYLQKHPTIIKPKEGRNIFLNGRFQLFNLVIAIIHAAAEFAVILVLYSFGMAKVSGAVPVYLTIIGVGGIIHSLVDFNIAYGLGTVLSKRFDIDVFKVANATEKKAKEEKAINAIAEV
jgi:niacin transporter